MPLIIKFHTYFNTSFACDCVRPALAAALLAPPSARKQTILLEHAARARRRAARARRTPHTSPATLQLVGEIRSPHRFVDNCWKTFDFQIRISGASVVCLSVGCEDELCVLPAGRGATPRTP